MLDVLVATLLERMQGSFTEGWYYTLHSAYGKRSGTGKPMRDITVF